MPNKLDKTLYSEEYDMVGKLVELNNQEAVLDLIDTNNRDLIYCNINKCHEATEEEIQKFFNK